MFSYYWELLNKPEYLLTGSEKMFVDVFPLLLFAAIVAVICIAAWIWEKIRRR